MHSSSWVQVCKWKWACQHGKKWRFPINMVQYSLFPSKKLIQVIPSQMEKLFLARSVVAFVKSLKETRPSFRKFLHNNFLCYSLSDSRWLGFHSLWMEKINIIIIIINYNNDNNNNNENNNNDNNNVSDKTFYSEACSWCRSVEPIVFKSWWPAWSTKKNSLGWTKMENCYC